jgi:hypothetical protein
MALAQAPAGDAAQPAGEEAAGKLLEIGDAAPAVKVATWVKGGPIETFEPGKVYVVLFWATHSRWSGEALSKLAAVQRGRSDGSVVCLAVALWERAVAAPEADFAGRVAEYTREHGAEWPFAVAYDGDFGAMNEKWMHAADRRWIPSVFVVDGKGMIAWMGHPLDERDRLEEVVAKVAAGTWDSAAALAQAKKDADTRTLLRQAERAWDFARRAGDTKELMKRLEEMYASNPEVGNRRLSDTLDAVFVESKAYEEGYPWLRRLGEGPLHNDGTGLNTAAWFIVDAPGVERRDLDLAMSLAMRASEVTGRNSAHIEDTVARVYFERGEIDKAIEYQTRAAGLATGPEKAPYERTLERYREKKKEAGGG